MIKLNIDVTKIDKTALFKGKKGTYMDLTLFDNREGPDQFDNDGFVVQDIGKTRRENGEKGPIIGNWKHAGKSEEPKTAARPAPRQAAPPTDDIDDIFN